MLLTREKFYEEADYVWRRTGTCPQSSGHGCVRDNPTNTHFKAALHVLRYLKFTRNYYIVYGCSSTVPITDIIGYSDTHKFPQQLALFLSSPKVERRSRSLTILPNIAKPSISMYAIMTWQNPNRLHSLGTSTCGSLYQSARNKASTVLSHDRSTQQLRSNRTS